MKKSRLFLWLAALGAVTLMSWEAFGHDPIYGTKDSDCPPGYIVVDGICVPDDGSGSGCPKDESRNCYGILVTPDGNHYVDYPFHRN